MNAIILQGNRERQLAQLARIAPERYRKILACRIRHPGLATGKMILRAMLEALRDLAAAEVPAVETTDDGLGVEPAPSAAPLSDPITGPANLESLVAYRFEVPQCGAKY